MTTVWVLYIAIGCNAWGCGSRHSIPFSSEESCYRALEKAVIVNAAKIAGGESQNQAAAYCAPQEVKVK